MPKVFSMSENTDSSVLQPIIVTLGILGTAALMSPALLQDHLAATFPKSLETASEMTAPLGSGFADLRDDIGTASVNRAAKGDFCHAHPLPLDTHSNLLPFGQTIVNAQSATAIYHCHTEP
jgi:hypothetical protein